MAAIEIIAFANFREASNLDDLIRGLPNIAAFVHLNWNSLQDLHSGRATTAYETLLKLSGDSVVNAFVVANPKPAENIPIVLGTPVSEFAVAKLILEENRDKWEACLKATLDGIKITKGAAAGIHATEEKDANTYVFVIGWSSIEVWFSEHRAAFDHAYASDIYRDTITLTDFAAKHARLKQRL
ncbi:uncharacterized protein LACBIDRAFT_321457 [Laccaria bicolor S238N-H82]|uniref:Predicted protein n=1 Tax=Laccaria bicolor (strain S238N-H82 / ATCC MYA-4686) TaxID=486041 RepID=B0CQF3_LACBS|nr:uncharacterized protein LACBIDRAFT_321457 [Laccaria bicolor S238N-H82]EDR15546.1 predicted protein [Laccaria bicolor S238N-H82]|eukprot:XP_001873754.1 predicted protein [Laccaria bicolor S238N-H82]